MIGNSNTINMGYDTIGLTVSREVKLPVDMAVNQAQLKKRNYIRRLKD